MKISLSFYSAKDLSDLSYGEKLLEILTTHELFIEKAGPYEPIREEFNPNNLQSLWRGVGLEGKSFHCEFLFKGKKEIRFLGMASWSIDLPIETKILNATHLWLTIPKTYNKSRLVQLADDLFTWSKAVYGFITEDSKDLMEKMQGNITIGLPDVAWVNYFSPEYINDPDFHLPNDHVKVGHGVRMKVTERPDDERLRDSEFIQSIKDQIGDEWFWRQPRRQDRKIPVFDKSEITKKQ